MQAAQGKTSHHINQVTALIIIFLIIGAVAAIPVTSSVRRLVYKVMYNYYKAPPSWSIVRLFDNYAEQFDEHLTKTLEYHTPSHLTDFITSNANIVNPIKKVLDLGCGTGLLGQELIKKFSIENLTGIDISSKMLQKAKDKAIYDELHNVDLLKYMQNNNSRYDLVTATDVFVYVGDLTEVISNVHKILKPNGYFAFSVESLPVGSFKITPSGRFQHSINYLQNLSTEIGFKKIIYKAVPLRKEYGVMIKGHLIVMQK